MAKQTSDREAYNAMVLQIVANFSPICSDYQIWRGIFGQPLDLKYPNALDTAICEMEDGGLLTKSRREGYPHYVYSITLAGKEWLKSKANPSG